MNDKEIQLEAEKQEAANKIKVFAITSFVRLGIIGIVFLFAHYNGMGYLWFLLLAAVTV